MLKFCDSQEIDYLMCENLAKYFLARDGEQYTKRSEVKCALESFCEEKGSLFTSISLREFKKTVSLIWRAKQLENTKES